MANADPPTIVVAAALHDRAGRLLVQRRPAGGSLAGLWEFPGGKVEAGEAPVAALARELHEELGIVVEDPPVPVAFACSPAGERPLVLLLFECRGWRGTPVPLAADELRWCAPAALADLAMPPLDRPLVAALVSRSAAAAPEASVAAAPEG